MGLLLLWYNKPYRLADEQKDPLLVNVLQEGTVDNLLKLI